MKSMTRSEKLGAWFGGIALGLALGAAILKGAAWAGDTRWVTHTILSQTQARQQVYMLNESIWEIEQKIKYGEASKAEELKLARQRDQLKQIFSGGPIYLSVQ
jgi:hypothetical protein